MAKRQNDQGESRPRAKIEYLKIEASDETIQKALQTIERSRGPIEVFTRPIKRLPNSASTPAEETLFDGNGVVDVEATEVEQQQEQEQETDATTGGKRTRGEGPVVDRNAKIIPAADVDFYPKDKQSLKEFFAAKNPTKDLDQCLVFCYFFQEILKLKPFGVGHVLLAFRHVNKPLPKDLGQTLRNMRGNTKRGKAWLSFANASDITVTPNGIGHVEHELGPGSSDGGNGAK